MQDARSGHWYDEGWYVTAGIVGKMKKVSKDGRLESCIFLRQWCEATGELLPRGIARKMKASRLYNERKNLHRDDGTATRVVGLPLICNQPGHGAAKPRPGGTCDLEKDDGKLWGL